MQDTDLPGDVVASGIEDCSAAAGPAQDCGGCGASAGEGMWSAGATRRDFLRGGSIAALGIFASLGLGSRAAAAMPVRAARLLASTAETKTYAIPAADGADIDKDAGVIIVRWQGSVIAFNLSCPHQNTALRWNQDAQRFQCPKHHSQYTPDGTFITGRATRGMDRMPITRAGNTVVVDLDHIIKQTDDMAAWTAAVIKV